MTPFIAGFADELDKTASATALLRGLGALGGAAYLLGGRKKRDKEVGEFERQKMLKARPQPSRPRQRGIKPLKPKLDGAIAKSAGAAKTLGKLGLGLGGVGLAGAYAGHKLTMDQVREAFREIKKKRERDKQRRRQLGVSI